MASSMNHIDESASVDDQLVASRPPSPILEQALLTLVPTRTANAIRRRQRTEK